MMQRLLLCFSMSFFLCFGLACRTAASGSETQMLDNPAYDGSAESLDSLPDCSPESLGTLFWVREIKTGFECMTGTGWTIRSFKSPDDESAASPARVVD